MNAYISCPGVLTCMGNNNELWQGLLDGKWGLTKAGEVFPEWFEQSESYIGSLIDLEPSGSRLLQILERLSETSISSQINKCDLILGAGSLGDLEGQFAGDPYGCMKHFIQRKYPEVASRFRGVVSSACSSGTDVISLAATLVHQKKYNIIGVLAADCLEPGKLLQHFALGTQTTNRARPFDINRSGTSFGEGGGFVIVANAEGIAQLNSDKIYQVLGFGMSCDALNITAPDESGEIPSLALKRALESAKCSASDIGYVNAHASGTLLNDQVESIAMRKIFGEQVSNIPVSGTKGAIGHLLGAVGLVEAIVACWSVDEGVAPGTIGLENIDEKLALSIVKPGEKRKLVAPLAMSTTFGFGGVNSSIIVTRNDSLAS